MNTQKVIGILDPGYENYGYEQELFEANGYELKLYDGPAEDPLAKINFSKNMAGLLVRMTVINNDFLKNLPHLKALVRYGIGYDNIDLTAAARYKIAVANVQGYATESVSDHALALMFACQRGIKIAPYNLKSAITKPPFTDMPELHDKILGIIGLGRIGSRFSQKAQGLFSRVIAYDPYIKDQQFKEAGAVKVSLDELLKRSSVISLHCNLTTETKHIIDEHAFEKMTNNPIIINTARGQVIQEEALIKALEKNHIHSAGIDVFENEPLTKKQELLIDNPRITATGHYAWYSVNASQALQKRAAHNMIDLLQGKIVADQLNTI